MKRVLLIIILISLIPLNNILADEYYDLDTNTIDSTIIEAGDLTLELTSDKTIEINSGKGLVIGNNLIINGNGSTLTIISDDNCLELGGSLNINNASLILKTNNGDYAYVGNNLSTNAYVLDENNNMAYYSEFDNTYVDYIDIFLPLTTLKISDVRYADFNNLASNNIVYKDDVFNIESYNINKGFLINYDEDESNVNYDESSKTYYVDIWTEFNDNKSTNFVELIFNQSEWAKILKYEIIESNNFYKNINLSNEYVVEEQGVFGPVGDDLYSSDSSATSLDKPSFFIMLVANTSNNNIIIKLTGHNNDIRYINLKVKDKDEEPIEENIINNNNIRPYIVVNTGVY